MIVFHADLDNTLIYSHKHEIGMRKRCAEIYQGREISFLTDRTRELLQQMQEYVQIVPTTTRTIEQYQRIALGTGAVRYALVCNGGELLVNGKNDEDWYAASKALTAESQDELWKAVRLLEREESRIMEVRFIQELFVFTKCSRPDMAAEYLNENLNKSVIDVFQNGTKVYVLPKTLSKGNALRRFQSYTGADTVFAAGDSAFDFSMLEQADLAACPADYACQIPADIAGGPAYPDRYDPMGRGIYRMSGRKLFSEEMLEFFLNAVRI